MNEALDNLASSYIMLGQLAEKEKDVDTAVKYYEKLVELEFEGSYPYDRLAVIYRKAKMQGEEARVLTRAIHVFENVPDERSDKVPKLARYRERLRKLETMS